MVGVQNKARLAVRLGSGSTEVNLFFLCNGLGAGAARRAEGALAARRQTLRGRPRADDVRPRPVGRDRRPHPAAAETLEGAARPHRPAQEPAGTSRRGLSGQPQLSTSTATQIHVDMFCGLVASFKLIPRFDSIETKGQQRPILNSTVALPKKLNRKIS